jgi:hypothetical protein
VAAKGHVLSDIKPMINLAGEFCLKMAGLKIPEVQVVNSSLLIAHVDIKRKQINRRTSSSTQNLEECREPIAILQR